MADDMEQDDEFPVMGTYSIVDGHRLLEALEKGGIDFEVEFRDGAADITPFQSYTGGKFGQAAQVTVRVAPNDRERAEQLHADLFGDCLPNYDASFFADTSNGPDVDDKSA
jgi:hypothetical protein